MRYAIINATVMIIHTMTNELQNDEYVGSNPTEYPNEL